MFRSIQVLPASIWKPISWNSSIYWWGSTYPSWLSYPPPMMGGGQPIPAALSSPPPRFFSSEWQCVLNCCLLLLQLLMDMFRKIQILPASIRKPISWNSSIYWWGQPIPAGLSYPPPMMGGGQPIPAGLSCPPPRFLSSEWLWVLNCC